LYFDISFVTHMSEPAFLCSMFFSYVAYPKKPTKSEALCDIS
jgi:hypothetical protein